MLFGMYYYVIGVLECINSCRNKGIELIRSYFKMFLMVIMNDFMVRKGFVMEFSVWLFSLKVEIFCIV